MKEYEYSFNVDSIEPYIEYCQKNNYINKSVTNENRIVYHNDTLKHVIARITTKEGVTTLDFKNKNNEDKELLISTESLPLIINDNMETIKSMLEALEFYEAANNTRIRHVYEKDNVKFEIDDYIKPKMCVVGIEGNKEEVDKVYNELKEIVKE